MTDIDIDQIRRTSQQLERPATHYDGCAKDHFGCAVLALIERLEKAEAQRSRLQEILEIILRGNHAENCAEVLFSDLACDCHIEIAKSVLEQENRIDE